MIAIEGFQTQTLCILYAFSGLTTGFVWQASKGKAPCPPLTRHSQCTEVSGRSFRPPGQPCSYAHHIPNQFGASLAGIFGRDTDFSK